MRINKEVLEGKVLKFNFDGNVFNFFSIFAKHFLSIGIDNLQNLHYLAPTEMLPKKIVDVKDDQNYGLYNYLYKIDNGYSRENSKTRSDFLKLYDLFILQIRKYHFDNLPIIYQSKPTLRIHLPNNKAVGAFHKDREYNHPIDEINFWLPITSTRETSTIWIETEIGSNEYNPWNLNYGEYLIFDSGLTHGNKVNIENSTRLSFDFRIIEKSNLSNISEIKASVKQNIDFKVGEYYSISE